MNRIRQLRTEKNLTLNKLTTELNKKGIKLNDGQLSKYEREEQKPRNENFWEIIASYFNVSVPYIMGISDERIDHLSEMKKLIQKANTITYVNSPEKQREDLEFRKNYLVNNIDNVNKYLINAIISEYPNWEIIGSSILNLLTSIDNLYTDEKKEQLLNLIPIINLLSNHNNGLFNNSLFLTTEKIRNSKVHKSTTRQATSEEALHNYFIFTNKLKNELDKYFLSQYNKKYNK